MRTTPKLKEGKTLLNIFFAPTYIFLFVSPIKKSKYHILLSKIVSNPDPTVEYGKYILVQFMFKIVDIYKKIIV